MYIGLVVDWNPIAVATPWATGFQLHQASEEKHGDRRRPEWIHQALSLCRSCIKWCSHGRFLTDVRPEYELEVASTWVRRHNRQDVLRVNMPIFNRFSTKVSARSRSKFGEEAKSARRFAREQAHFQPMSNRSISQKSLRIWRRGNIGEKFCEYTGPFSTDFQPKYQLEVAQKFARRQSRRGVCRMHSHPDWVSADSTITSIMKRFIPTCFRVGGSCDI